LAGAGKWDAHQQRKGVTLTALTNLQDERPIMIQRVFRENVDAQNVRLGLLLKLLQNMFAVCEGHHTSSPSLTLLFASVLKVEQAARTVQLITEEGYVDEVLSISRTLVEVTVNAAYFQYATPTELEGFIRFQPTFSHNRESAGRRLGSGGPSSGVLSLLYDLVRKRQQPSITEPSWTRTTLLARARFVDEMSQIPIMAPLVERCHIRGHAALHGTMGSLRTFVSMLTPSATDASENLVALGEALFVVNLSLLTLCMYLNAYFRLGMDEAIDEAASAGSRHKAGVIGG
jgi:hypothetical protein